VFLDFYVTAHCNLGFAVCGSYIQPVWPPLVYTIFSNFRNVFKSIPQLIDKARYEVTGNKVAHLPYMLLQIKQWTLELTEQYPNLLQRAHLTNSTEGREVPYLVMGSSIDNPLFVIDCGIHAREWIAPAFCQYFVHRVGSIL